MKLPKLLLLSDLHLERMHHIGQKTGEDIIQEINDSLPRRNKPIIILAGDIHQGTQGITWAKQINAPVIYVPGNHEFWDTDYLETIQALKRESENSNVHVLINESVDLKGIRFIGALLWPDLGAKLGWTTNQALIHGAEIMNDYSTIRYTQWYADHQNIERLYKTYAKWQAEYYITRKAWNPLAQIDEHHKSIEYLNIELDKAEKEKIYTVAITHHVPCYESMYQTGWNRQIEHTDRYDSDFDDGYFNRYYHECARHRVPQKENLLVLVHYASDIFKQKSVTHRPHIWLHGHNHEPVAYINEGTYIVSSPTRKHTGPDKLIIPEKAMVCAIANMLLSSADLNAYAKAAEGVIELLELFDKTTSLHKRCVVDNVYYHTCLKLIHDKIKVFETQHLEVCTDIFKKVLPGLFIGINVNNYEFDELLHMSGLLCIEKQKKRLLTVTESKFCAYPSHGLFVSSVHAYSSAEEAVYKDHVKDREYNVGGDHHVEWRKSLENCRDQFLLNMEALQEWLQSIIYYNSHK